LNSDLTQVLSDGTNDYIYGVGRIAQVNATGTEYFLGDALGSVRQMTDAAGTVTLAKSYQPYGEVASSAGSSATNYGFTGEMTDPTTGLVYLRARHYDPNAGRFLNRDTWQGNYNKPLSLNRWNYAEGNPIKFSDPSGHWVYDRGGAVTYAMNWDHQAGLDPTYDFSSNADNMDLSNQCTLFASSVLYHANVRDTRADPNPEKKVGGTDLNPAYWDINILMNYKWQFLGYKSDGSWYRTNPFYDFAKLIGTVVLTYSNPPWYNDKITEGTKTSLDPNWDAYLRANQGTIQKGDLVFYGDGTNWSHVAVVVGWGFPTYFGPKDNPGSGPTGDEGWANHLAWIESLRRGCSDLTDLPIQPLVVERSGGIAYTDFRSLDNTYARVSRITVIHVQDQGQDQ
jgi:RHS repeat-associated protein